jgi:arsenite methyltransferase
VTAGARAAVGCCAELYELPIVEYLLGQSFHPGGPRLTRQLANTTLVGPDTKVLDVACGNGNSARIVAADFGARVAGCDFSGVNIQRATSISLSAGLDERTSFIRGSAEQLPFDAQSFDVVLCECSLCLFENPDTALAEIFRVLKPGGRIGISDFYLNAPVPEGLDGPLGQALCIAGAASTDILQNAFARAAFSHIRLRKVNWTLREMIARVRRNLAVLATARPADLALPAAWGDPVPMLEALEQFIGSEGAGYLIVSARKP